VLLLVAFAVLTGIKFAVDTVDPSTIPSELRPIWDGVSYIFLTSAATPLFTFVRNIYGYAENYLGAKPEDRALIQYEANLLWQTWLKYEQYIKGFTILTILLTRGTPLEPYAVYIAGSISFAVDLIRKSLADLA